MAETLDVDVRELDRGEWAEVVEAMAQHYFHMSAEQFRAAWEAGEFDSDPCRPGLQKLAMLLPVGGPDS